MRINFYASSRYLRVDPMLPSSRVTFRGYTPKGNREKNNKEQQNPEKSFKKTLEKSYKKDSFNLGEKEKYDRYL